MQAALGHQVSTNGMRDTKPTGQWLPVAVLLLLPARLLLRAQVQCKLPNV